MRITAVSMEWNVHYSRWMIDDGSPDRRIGETFSWSAIKFICEERLVFSSTTEKSAVEVGDYDYRVVAEVKYIGEEACIIDFGLQATSFSESLPSGCKVGEFVSGNISLDLPLSTEVPPDPPLRLITYKWRVVRISADLTPFIQNPRGGWFRDASNVRYSEVASTDEVQTHSYVLHCSEVAS